MQSADEQKQSESPSPPSHLLSYDNGIGATHGEATRVTRAWWKMDCFVLPIVTSIFFLCFLDRGNVGNARIAGLQKDLNMSNYQYSLALTITVIPYVLIEIPSNLWLKRIGPNIVLPLMTVLWGIATTLQGTVTSYGGLIACRFFIGLFEGGLSPGCMLYLSSFYPRRQLQLRISIYFTAPTIAGAFSGLLASAILHMDGIGGKPGWAWVFILEGLFTILFGLCTFFILPRTPSHVPFLTPEEKAYVARVLHDENTKLSQMTSGIRASDLTARKTPYTDRDHDEDESYTSEKADKIRWRDVLRVLKLPHIWLIGIIAGVFNGATLSGLTYFTPSIVASLGYLANKAQLMSVPPFIVSFVLAIASSYLSDRYSKRGLTIIVFALLGVAGFGIFLGSHHPHARYASLFLILPGTYAMASPLVAWISNNTHTPYTTRATSIALLTVATNSGGIFSTWLLGSWSKPPGYTSAAWCLGMFQVGIAVCAGVCWAWLWRENRRGSGVGEEQYVM
ncbi:MFS general substrate transporter [Irpex rosettiformis]|uniref:MFS general substrate transporter n=1 Tax=Irpex rosettiformis TaxID=378272 RepID=A0ACB8U729_9APHY|nr:MFS general substrate transporter [Irpex rosettiformis]